ncbi:hypothetical protein Mapa_010708 [Marchantia paleacea]|nr:hypothetical protein Mapa_010708 [Marchantia paleacea]
MGRPHQIVQGWNQTGNMGLGPNQSNAFAHRSTASSAKELVIVIHKAVRTYFIRSS